MSCRRTGVKAENNLLFGTFSHYQVHWPDFRSTTSHVRVNLKACFSPQSTPCRCCHGWAQSTPRPHGRKWATAALLYKFLFFIFADCWFTMMCESWWNCLPFGKKVWAYTVTSRILCIFNNRADCFGSVQSNKHTTFLNMLKRKLLLNSYKHPRNGPDSS